MKGKRIVPKILRCAIIALVAALAVFYCLSLKYENLRTSDIIDISGSSDYLGDGDEVCQELHIDEGEEKLLGVAILFIEKDINPEGTVIVAVYRDGEKFSEWERKGQFIQTTQCEYFQFDKAESTPGHKYEVRIGFSGFGEWKPFAFHKCESDKHSAAVVNGRSLGGPIFYLNIYDEVPVWQQILIPIIVFFAFTAWQGIYFLLIKPKFKLGETGDFAAIYIGLLLLYYIFVPLNTIFDEGNHFMRSYSIAHGKLISDAMPGNSLGGDYLPEGVSEYGRLFDINAYHNGHRQNDEPLKALTADWNEVKETLFPNTAINAPHMYLPQAIGIRSVELFTSKPYYMAYGGRFVNMVITAFLVLLAIYLTPSGKNYLKFAALLPMMMQETVSLAPDSFISALIMVYIALILRSRFKDEGELKLSSYLLLYLLTIAVVTCKMVYAPICLLLFLVPRSRFGKRSRYYASVALFAVSVITFLLSWLLVLQRYNLRFQYSNNEMQIDYILSHPVNVLSVFGNYILDSGKCLIELMGGNLGHDNIPQPSFTAVLFILIAGLWCYRMIRIPKDKDYGSRFIPAVIVAAVYILIGTAEYVGWTKVGSSVLHGVSGRYLLPVIPLIMFAISGMKKDEITPAGTREKARFVTVMLNLFALVSFWIYTVF